MYQQNRLIIGLMIVVFGFCSVIKGQDLVRDLKLTPGASVDVVNHFGRIVIVSVSAGPEDIAAGKITATSTREVTDKDIKITTSGNRIVIETVPKNSLKRIDLNISLPARSLIKAETSEGAIAISGNLASIQATTETGTISLDVPTENISYQFLWTESRPRYVADFELENVKELSAGKFSIKGHFGERSRLAKAKRKGDSVSDLTDSPTRNWSVASEPDGSLAVMLNITTARGIILLNVPPNEVGSDLRERPLTEAAKAIVRSGDSLLMEAIRRAAPKYYGEYARTLPPYERQPVFASKSVAESGSESGLKTALLRVTDLRNRAISGLTAGDFEIAEGGSQREIVSVEPSTAPFNLVMLLDVSGSIENYVDFIRKAARNFVNTIDRNDRLSIVIFNEDVKVLSGFTTDKLKLSESLDSFDAGGGTAYYDALAYVVSHSLRPLRGERTAIVILTDGDDNRSFLGFDSLSGSIQESGSLIFPLYVPSGLIAQAEQNKNSDIDPMRKKYMSLTAKSEGEGEKLAKISGGVYYPITQIAQLQKAYEDIVLQMRTAYLVKFRSSAGDDRSQSRLKIKIKRENAFVTINSLTVEK